ncbi:LysR substrate-binding domain-containing protein [Hoeflea sp. CAU 1731]
MTRRHYRLPSLTALAVFEAAARHLSLKHAAQELNVTPGAVSHQIKALEAEIGIALFLRVHRGVVLTPEGEELYATLATSFSRTAAVIERIRAPDSDRAITIGASTAVASLWLIPRIARLWQRHPDIHINHRVSDVASDLEGSDVDLVIRYGDGKWQGATAIKLFADVIVPVCGRDFAKHHPVRDAADLVDLPLLQLQAIDVGWMSWNEWFRLCGVKKNAPVNKTFNNYTIALQAAEEGAGVVLGWRRLIRTYLDANRLVPITDASVDAPSAYYLTWNSDRTLSAAEELTRNWLVDAA